MTVSATSNNDAKVNANSAPVANPADSYNIGDASEASKISNQFMTLMIAQIENQDPTNPMDSNEYVSQLAQMSQVESLELIRENQAMQMTMLENSTIVQSASLIGKQAMVPASELTLADEPITGKVFLESAAEQVSVDIKDENGKVVATVELGAQSKGDIPFEIDPEALGLPPGEYTLAAKASADGDITELSTFLVGEIEKIHFASASGMMLAEMSNGLGTVSVLSISEVAGSKDSNSNPDKSQES
ncbi:flagellar hook assembly protein FlgD [Ferrimonas aestuarii]|uniref:Basal-body rod modification protein FlgD n=1 Tax=Ferrimonas aestuarii TaxID=2569539 RepID=A0A4U1BMQ4_9GAMM|nr:flagellar hook capping FlgD N-terminal domain-containing protein [Ferrimonas aestuarii]TKB54580.1 flagellar biosynthesis protein FlgD [Ferrimonas aestuarii]